MCNLYWCYTFFALLSANHNRAIFHVKANIKQSRHQILDIGDHKFSRKKAMAMKSG